MIARNRLVRTLSADANARNRELQIRLSAEEQRIRTYYADLREELQDRRAKLEAKGEDTLPLDGRLAALRLEESMRMEEISRKGVLRAELRLINLLYVKIPRLFLSLRAVVDRKLRLQNPQLLTVTWDPMMDRFDAVNCPNCKAPTFEVVAVSGGRIGCPSCK